MEDNAGLGPFVPGDLQTSRMRWYSMGLVADNKKLGSMDVEVTPTEELTMLNGEITSNSTDYKANAQDTLGKTYESSVKTQATVTATWLRFGDAQRMSAPDVRRGEAVMLYQFGDSNKFYWMTIKQDSALRRLETVIYAISANKTEGTPMDADNTYYFEWSSHKKLTTLHTSKVNGELFAYTIQISGAEGYITITDDVGNYITLNSADTRLEMKNIDGCHWDMNKRDLTVTVPGKVLYDVGEHFTVKSPLATIDAKTNITKDTLMEMNTTTTLNTTVNGGLGVTQINGTGGTGKNKLKGGLIIETEGIVIEQGGLEVTGDAVFHSNVSMDLDLAVAGYASLSGGYG